MLGKLFQTNFLSDTLQEEINDCGLCCLAMILQTYRRPTTLSYLKKRFSYAGEALSMATVSSYAEALGLMPNAVKLDSADDIKELSLPAVLHWNMNHFVVLLRIKKNLFTIFDPRRGQLEITKELLVRSFTGVALEVANGTSGGDQSDFMAFNYQFSRFIPNFDHHKIVFFGLLIITIVSQMVTLIAPVFTQYVIDNILVAKNYDLLQIVLGALLCLIFFEVAFNILKAKLSAKLSSEATLDIGSNLLVKKFHLFHGYFDHRSVGDVLSRYESSTHIGRIISNELVTISIDFMVIIFSLSAMIFYSAKLSLIVVALATLYLWIKIKRIPAIESITKQQIATKASFDSYFFESVSELRAIKMFSKETARSQGAVNKLVDRLNSDIDLLSLDADMNVWRSSLWGLTNALILYFSAILIIQNMLTIGAFFAFLAYQNRFLGTVSSFVDNLLRLQTVKIHLNRMADFLDQEKEEIYQGQAKINDAVDASNSGVTVNMLGYCYSERSKSTFTGLSFSIPEGSIFAITGQSGRGKSTLLNCLSGFLRPTCGSVTYLDENIYGSQTYRQKISIVGQGDRLLNGTVKQNVSFFDTKPDSEKILKCMRLACIEDEILALPMGLETLIYGNGANLSGGQIQRILIARALYKDPKVLFLDEGTSQIDPSTEKAILTALKSQSLTVVIVAHRLETLHLADFTLEL